MDLENSKIIEVIKEQKIFKFSGRINFLKDESHQLLGSILIENGEVFFATYKKREGIKAFICILIDELLEGLEIKTIIEPELVNKKEQNIFFDFNQLMDECGHYLKKTSELKKMGPPHDFLLSVNKQVFNSKPALSHHEFIVLRNVIDFSNVGDIYKNTDLLECEVTEALVALRKKGALIVLGQKNEQKITPEK